MRFQLTAEQWRLYCSARGRACMRKSRLLHDGCGLRDGKQDWEVSPSREAAAAAGENNDWALEATHLYQHLCFTPAASTR